jgi:DNA-binding NarL/FixJ family response regulator
MHHTKGTGNPVLSYREHLTDTGAVPHNVLIVDDSPDVRHIVRTFLERDTAFTVCGEAPDGLEAIKKAQELKPDLVLLDLSMPGMNGIETAMVLRRLLPKIHIVLFSNYTDQLGTTLASAVGIDLVLSKGSLADMAKSLKGLAPRPGIQPTSPPESAT